MSASARDQLVARLGELARQGVEGLPAPAASSATGPGADATRSLDGMGAGAPAGGAPADWRDLGLPALSAFLADCTRCKLSGCRTQVVFGVGNPDARLMFVGEAPGRDEDLQGEPFVGRAGQLLTEMIERGMGLRRQDVYIANLIKCRPPENRNPEPDEVAACQPFLLRQLALVRPEVVVALGRFAAQALLATTQSLASLRGRWHEHAGIPVAVTYHPAYLLRSPGEKRHAWEDLKMVMARLGLARPPR